MNGRALGRALVSLVLVAGSTAVTPTLAAAPTARTVDGEPCTVVGTPGDDVLRGTTGDDVICGLGGDDVLIGGGGDDVLAGGSGSDDLSGGSGEDTLIGGGGSDEVSGGRDDDTARGGAGPDVLEGASGDDVLIGNGNDDVLVGGGGTDEMFGGKGADTCDQDATDESAGSCRYDFAGPRVVSLSMEPAEVSVGERLTIELQLSDPSGVDVAGVTYEVRGVQNDFCGQSMELVSGSSTDGTWRLTCFVPDDTRNGEYSVTPFAADRMNNPTNFNGGDIDETRATFRVTGGSSDTAGPTVLSLRVEPEEVEVGERLTIDLRLEDASGVKMAGVTFEVRGVQNDFCGQWMQLVAGDSISGTWRLQCFVPDDARNGEYTVTPFAQDRVNNYTNVNGGDIDKTRATFTLTGGSSDSSGPKVMSLTAEPASVTVGDRLTIDLQLEDPSGVKMAGVTFEVRGVQNDFCGQSMQLVAGTLTSGTWRLRCFVPSSARAGEYTVTPFAWDRVNNYTNVNGGDIDKTRANFTVR